MNIRELLQKYPYAEDFFRENDIDISGNEEKTFEDFLHEMNDEYFEEKATTREKLVSALAEYIEMMKEFLGEAAESKVKNLTLISGYNKKGEKENYNELTINTSQIVAIVGPTGSGKSRLLADIEWIAQGDTPTKRRVLINGKTPDIKKRFSSSNKLVSQLSQNMNFVMDLKVKEFITLHAQSRLVENIEHTVEKIISEANRLAGERFSDETDITALSGGQSRALMIADTAILSKSPIVLIDEIENAGIDRTKALELLVSQDKIVIMATHDPTLALLADTRVIINSGGIVKVIKTSQKEKQLLKNLEEYDKKIGQMRKALRYAQVLDDFVL